MRTRAANPRSEIQPHQHHTALKICAYGAPVLAQIIMLIALLIRQQWLFAIMIAGGCIGTSASLIITFSQFRSSHESHSPDAGVGHNLISESAEFQKILRIWPSQSLEELLDLANDYAPLRTIAYRWCAHHTGCVAEVGSDECGAPVYIDLEHDGPHAIVAGTTGSGKSVLLQDWCLSLACTYTPDQLQFVLLDFKGGSALERLTELPHVRGCVSDLDLQYATRALLSLERELTRREQLAARLGVSDLMQSQHTVARLVIVVDEFHMLHGQLPDYIDRLVRIASLGRSLGMHLIACTQNPLGQISTSMKANMSLRICLRVRDALQSQEMLGSSQASHISASAPGMAIMLADDTQHYFRCAHAVNISRLVNQIQQCSKLYHINPPPALFTAPLPKTVSRQMIGICEPDDTQNKILIGLCDDGVTLAACMLNLADSPIAVIGRHGCGKTSLLTWITTQANTYHIPVQCFDDADMLLDPCSYEPNAVAFRTRLQHPSEPIIFSLCSTKHLRMPEHCTTRLIFPTGERAVDLADGIPSELLRSMTTDDFHTPGRAVLINGGHACLVQLIAPS